ncbi:MAG: hypothetical protein PUE58_06365 [Lachnospiraceae bacterium]|nr:hypothetical protein [Lachnospiraceae bacterium]
MKIWFKEWKDSHMVRDLTVEIGGEDTRTHKIFQAVDQMCLEFDLAHPIWLDQNIREFQKRSKTRFTADCFQDEIDFDYLEIQVLEEDGF